MISRNLMARARELVGRRAASSALMIVPLAMAAPAHGDTTFVLGTSSITHASGGSFGNASSALVNNGQSVALSGDTLTGPNSYLSAGLAVENYSFTQQSATILYTWTGSFAPGGSRLNGADDFATFAASIAPIISPNEGNDTVSWVLDATVSSGSGRVLAEDTISSSDGNSSANDTFSRGTPEQWKVTLDVQWTFPVTFDTFGIEAVNPQDALDVSPQVGLSIFTATGTTVPSTPLPASMWSGGSLLALLAAGAALRRSRARGVGVS